MLRRVIAAKPRKQNEKDASSPRYKPTPLRRFAPNIIHVRGEQCAHSVWQPWGLVVAGAVSTGGLATLAIKVLRKKNHAAETASNAEEKEQ